MGRPVGSTNKKPKGKFHGFVAPKDVTEFIDDFKKQLGGAGTTYTIVTMLRLLKSMLDNDK